jgi:hypothetical protein
MEVSGDLHAPAALSTRKSRQYPMDRRLNGLQSISGYGEEQKNLSGNRTRALQPVALYQLSYHNSKFIINLT